MISTFWLQRDITFLIIELPSYNVLPPNVINSSSLNGFKATLDKFTKNGL